MIINYYRSAKANKGVLTRVGSGQALFQQAYVGNMAWGHLVALSALRRDTTVAGQPYFLTDDTPLMSSFKFMEPFLSTKGFSLSPYSLPYSLIYSLLYMTETVLWLLSPLYKVNMETPLCSLIYINMNIYFSRQRAEKKLGYKPLFTYDDSVEKSLKFYKEAEI